MMKHCVRGLGNHVNLGTVYGVKPCGRSLFIDIPRRPGLAPPNANLRRQYSVKPEGWAYFDDGSIFITSAPHADHGDFEARAKFAAHRLGGRPPEDQTTTQGDVKRQRLIVIR